MAMYAYRTGSVVGPEQQSARGSEATLVASGDLRATANWAGWQGPFELDARLTEKLSREGVEFRCAHPYDPEVGHRFVPGRQMGGDGFREIERFGRRLRARREVTGYGLAGFFVGHLERSVATGRAFARRVDGRVASQGAA
jgi:hypothetical protein